MNAKAVLLVAVGGALGSVLRYMATLALNSAFPLGTVLVNILGCFIMGCLAGYSVLLTPLPEPIRLFFMVGVLGGFTTFSAFSLDVMTLAQQGQYGLALFYTMLSVFASLCAVFAGFMLMRLFYH